MTTHAQRPPATDDDETVAIRVRLTWPQFRELNQRAGLAPLGGARARSEYIVGCLFGEPHAALIERVQKIAEKDRAAFRAEIAAEREAREERERQRAAEREERERQRLRELAASKA